MPPENKERPNQPYSAAYPTRVTSSGRTVVDPRASSDFADSFIWPDLCEQKKSGGFKLDFLLAQGEAALVFQRDDLRIKPIVSQVQDYLSPNKIKSGVTETPRHRTFERVASITARRGDEISEMEILQEPGNAKRRYEKYPPVVRKSPGKVHKTLSPPDSPHKRARRQVSKEDIENARKNKRRGPKRLFANTSANEIKQAQFPHRTLEEKFVLSHLDQVGSGGKDVREQVVVVPEGENIRRYYFVEKPATDAIVSSETNVESLLFESIISTQEDIEGERTHIGGGLEENKWTSPGATRSVGLRHDSENPEFPTRAAGNMTGLIYYTVFSSGSSSGSSESNVSDAEPDVKGDATLPTLS